MSTAEKPTELRRDLGLWAALAIVVGTVIGSGIFRVPQTMIQDVGSVRLVFLVWVVGGALSLDVARLERRRTSLNEKIM